MFAGEANNRWNRGQAGNNIVRCLAVHPGNVISSNLARRQGWPLRLIYALARPWAKTLAQAAATPALAAFAPEMAAPEVGCYLCNCFPSEPAPAVVDDAARAGLWTLTENILKDTRSIPSESMWLDDI